jgi:hypothetical protein
MGAYENPQIQSLDYSFVTQGVTGMGAALAAQKQKRSELKEKIKLRKMKLIEQEMGMMDKITQLPKAQAASFDDNVKKKLNAEVVKIQGFQNEYAKSGSLEDYEKYERAKQKLMSSLPKMKMAIDNMNKDLTQGAKAVDGSKLEGQDGTWSYETPLWAINMAKDWKEGGGKINMIYDNNLGEWNIQFEDKGINSKAWLNKVSETGSGIFHYVENNYLIDDKKTFEAIAGDNYRGFVTQSQSDPKDKGIFNESTIKSYEDWMNANDNLNKRFNEGESTLLKYLDNTLTKNRWEAQKNYSKFGEFDPKSKVQVIKDKDGKIIAYVDTWDEEKQKKQEGKIKDKDGEVIATGIWRDISGKQLSSDAILQMEENQESLGNTINFKEPETISQLDYFRNQTWNSWQDQYAMKDKIKTKQVTSKTTFSSPNIEEEEKAESSDATEENGG